MAGKDFVLIDNFHSFGSLPTTRKYSKYKVKFDKVSLVGDYRHSYCYSTLEKKKGIFTGQVYVKDQSLKEIKKGKINFPVISISDNWGNEKEGKVTLSMDLGGVSFSTTYVPSHTPTYPSEFIDRGIYFDKLTVCWPVTCELLGWFIQNMVPQRISAIIKGENIFSNDLLKDILNKKHCVIDNGTSFKLEYRLIEGAIERDCNEAAAALLKTGMVIKRTKIWYNKIRKEESELLIVSPVGVILVFNDNDINLEAPQSISYVGLA